MSEPASMALSSLVEIRKQIKELQVHVDLSMNTALNSALSIGKLLLQAKEKLKGEKGSWQKWLADLPFSERTAQSYMQLARNEAEVLKQAKAQDIAPLTLTAANKLVKKPSKKSAKPSAVKDHQAKPHAVDKTRSHTVASESAEHLNSTQYAHVEPANDSIEKSESSAYAVAYTTKSVKKNLPSDNAASVYAKLTGNESPWLESDLVEHTLLCSVSEMIGDELLNEAQKLKATIDQATELSDVQLATLLACMSIEYIRRVTSGDSAPPSESLALVASTEVG